MSNPFSDLLKLVKDPKVFKDKADIKVSDAEYENFASKADATVKKAIVDGKSSCLLSLSWINKEVADAGKDAMLSYLIFAPESNHRIGKQVNLILDRLRIATFIRDGYRLSYGGCNEGTYVSLQKDDLRLS